MLDQKDRKIISVLKNDARAPIRDIAKKTLLRPSTVHQRMLRLSKDKVIEKFTVKLNNKLTDENFIVFIFVKGKPTQYLTTSILKNPHVKEIFGVTGEYDLLIKLKFKDVEEFNEFLICFRKTQKGISNTLTMVATANLKEEL
jgi:DNA-binding Lrp family transcriptional regulator